MTLYEYADALSRLEWTFQWHPKPARCRYTVSVYNLYGTGTNRRLESPSGGMLGIYGEGATPEAAMKDYVRRIKGRQMIYAPSGTHEQRRLVDVPKVLKVE